MKGMVKWLLIIFGVVVWASCTQLTNFDLPSEDGTQDPTPDEVTDVDVEADPDADVEAEVPPECGNGEVEGTEECDDGNDVAGDGCENDCTWTCTGDGDCNDGDDCDGEETCNLTTHMCEEGTPQEDGFVCQSTPRSICLSGVCEESECGDGFIDTGATPPESCDPPEAGVCSDTCQTLCDGDEDCPDDSNPCNGDEYCNTTSGLCESQNPMDEGEECQADPRRICIDNTCQESTCGDEYTDTGATPAEECDDGNTTPDDGCENDCTFSCHEDTDCADGELCNGDETCDTTTSHMCQAGTNADSGTACNDDQYCTATDECDGSGACVGTGDPCVDSLDCTTGETCNETDDDCDYTITSGNCLIDSTCYADGTDNSTNECQECVAATSQTAWTNKADTTACTDDGLSCTADECLSGSCDHSSINSGTCLISGACYNNGDDNGSNECQECVSGTSQTAWTNKADGTACTDDGVTCTGDTCQSGTCDHSTITTGCYIDSTCYAEGTDNPSNECQECVGATSRTAWTNKADETSCGTAGVCCSGTCNDPASSCT